MKTTLTAKQAAPCRHILTGLLAAILPAVAFLALAVSLSAAPPTTASKDVKKADVKKDVKDSKADAAKNAVQKKEKSKAGIAAAASRTYECTKCTQRKDGTITTPPPTTVGSEKCKHTWFDVCIAEARYKHSCSKCGKNYTDNSANNPPPNPNNAYHDCPTSTHKWEPRNVTGDAKYRHKYKCAACNYEYEFDHNNWNAEPGKQKPNKCTKTSNGDHAYRPVKKIALYQCKLCAKVAETPVYSVTSSISGVAGYVTTTVTIATTVPPPPTKADCPKYTPTAPVQHTWSTVKVADTTYSHRCRIDDVVNQTGCNKFIPSDTNKTGPNTRDCPKGPHVWKAVPR